MPDRRCLHEGCKGVYKAVQDGLTVEAGGFPLTDDRTELRCDKCGRTPQEAFEEAEKPNP